MAVRIIFLWKLPAASPEGLKNCPLTDGLAGLGGSPSSADPSEVESVLSSLAEGGWAPTSASQGSGVAAALAGRPPWAVGTAPFVSACPWAPNTLPSWAISPWDWPEEQIGGPASTPSPPFLLSALCSFGCGSGICIAPNVCSCQDGEQGATCPGNWGWAGAHGKNSVHTEITCQTPGSWVLAHHLHPALLEQQAFSLPLCR